MQAVWRAWALPAPAAANVARPAPGPGDGALPASSHYAALRWVGDHGVSALGVHEAGGGGSYRSDRVLHGWDAIYIDFLSKHDDVLLIVY